MAIFVPFNILFDMVEGTEGKESVRTCTLGVTRSLAGPLLERASVIVRANTGHSLVMCGLLPYMNGGVVCIVQSITS